VQLATLLVADEWSCLCRAPAPIKGAYTQSRLRQFIFGGTTSYILSNATIPVLMAQ
jgi:nucleotide-binding universal stress UspA family protein